MLFICQENTLIDTSKLLIDCKDRWSHVNQTKHLGATLRIPKSCWWNWTWDSRRQTISIRDSSDSPDSSRRAFVSIPEPEFFSETARLSVTYFCQRSRARQMPLRASSLYSIGEKYGLAWSLQILPMLDTSLLMSPSLWSSRSAENIK